MIDISSLNPLFIQIPLLAILVIGLIGGLKDGIVKKLLDLVFFVVLIGIMIFIVPPVAKQLENTGVIQNFVNTHLTGDIATLVSGLLTGPVYLVITTLGIMLIYGIIKFFINFIFTRLFHKNVFIRLLGGVWQTALNLVFCGFLMIIIASPTLFKGGHELLTNTDGVKQVYGGVLKVQETLKNHDLPYDLESIFARSLAGKDATKEDLARYQSTLERLPNIIDSAKNGTIQEELTNPDGTINQEKANQLMDDFIVFSELVNKLPESQQAKVAEPLIKSITSGRDALIDEEGNAKATIEVTEEQKNSLNEACTNIGVDATVLSDLNKALVVKTTTTE